MIRPNSLRIVMNYFFVLNLVNIMRKYYVYGFLDKALGDNILMKVTKLN